jgi:glycerol-3-phosphate acyltransferase PlsY
MVRKIYSFSEGEARKLLVCYSHFLYFCPLQRTFSPESELVSYIVGLTLGYIIGSIPTAYLLVRWKSRIDIRTAGSGNVGAMNTFDVTGSKPLGLTVLVLDLFKGVAAVIVAGLLFDREFWEMAIAGVAAMIGHNYPVWLRFRGGRGLSTAAGVMLILGWIFVAIWCTLWALTFLPWKNIHRSNILASIGTPIAVAFVPNQPIHTVLASPAGTHDVFYLTIAICCVILLRHSDSWRSLFTQTTQHEHVGTT